MSRRVESGELLLEVRVEEIPARMLPGAVHDLGSRLFEELMGKGVPPAEIESGFTPRRLWIAMRGLPETERDRETVEIGPPAAVAFDAQGNPTPAALGFARKFGVDVSQLKRRDFSSSSQDHDKAKTALKGPEASGGAGAAGAAGKGGAKGGGGKGGGGKVEGERVVLDLAVPGRATREILRELIPATLRGLAWAKTMRWGSGVGPWVRPVHGIVALLDGEIVPFELFGISAGKVSAGHPTLSPEPFEVTGIDDWREKLSARGIVPSPVERQERLHAEMTRRAAAAGGVLVEDAELLGKLAAICEIPGVMEGAFAPDLLELPREVLATSLRDHQSALTVESREGSGTLLPLFLTVMDRPDDPQGLVRAGNEWVVAARLADAAFFWQKDRTRRLEERVGELAGVAFHAKLGSYAAKSARVATLARRIAERLRLPAAELDALGRAAALAKVDLTTDMVREFTSLQGVMGGIYARTEGEPPAVWQAIYDQYRPAGSTDELPRSDQGRAGRVLALADRLDTLVGFFALGQVPTGSKDPFGLRRSALGAVRLIIESGFVLDLPELAAAAHSGFDVALAKGAEESWKLLRPFLDDRLRFLFELKGCAYDEIEAGLQRSGEKLSDLPALEARIAALHQARDDRDFLAVVLAAKRIANITKGVEATPVDASALELDEERSLHEAARAFEGALEIALARRDFASGLAAVSRLSPSLEAFFLKVLVMDPDAAKRTNRLALLAGLGRSIGQLADLSQLVVDKADYR